MLGPPSASAQYAARRSTCWGWKPWLNAWPTTSSAITRRLENSLHASIMTIVPCLCKTMAAANSDGGNAIRAIRQDPAKYGSRLVAKCRAIWYEIFRLVDDGPIGNKNIATELPTLRELTASLKTTALLAGSIWFG